MIRTAVGSLAPRPLAAATARARDESSCARRFSSISTNLKQLKESTRAVYGAGFDGYTYLKRFFDMEFTRPDPDRARFTELLLQQYPAFKCRPIISGLPAVPKLSDGDALSNAIQLISDAFDLDLRSQRQVFLIASVAASNIDVSKKLHILWLFFLCAFRHRTPEQFAILIALQPGQRAEFNRLFLAFVNKPPVISWESGAMVFGTNKAERQETTALVEVMGQYFDASKQDLAYLNNRLANSNTYNYPDNVFRALVEEMPNPYNPHQPNPPSIAAYYNVVRLAGQFR